MRSKMVRSIKKILFGEPKIDLIRGFVSRVKNKDAVRLHAIEDDIETRAKFSVLGRYSSIRFIDRNAIQLTLSGVSVNDLMYDKYGMGHEEDPFSYYENTSDEDIIIISEKIINEYRKSFFKEVSEIVSDKKTGFIVNAKPDIDERYLSDVSNRVVDVAEHDVLVKLARLTGFDVVLVDLDKASSECVRFGYVNVLCKIRDVIAVNKNSIVFFRKKSAFSYDRIQKKIFNEMLSSMDALGGKNNYLIITNQKGYNDQGFTEYNLVDGKLIIDEK